MCLTIARHPDNFKAIGQRSRSINQNVKFAILLSLSSTYILIDCTCFGAAPQRYLGVDVLRELFENVECRHIVVFIKDKLLSLYLVFILAK